MLVGVGAACLAAGAQLGQRMRASRAAKAHCWLAEGRWEAGKHPARCGAVRCCLQGVEEEDAEFVQGWLSNLAEARAAFMELVRCAEQGQLAAAAAAAPAAAATGAECNSRVRV